MRAQSLRSRMFISVFLCLALLGTRTEAQSELRDINTHCPFTPPTSVTEWEKRASDLKLQLSVALCQHSQIELQPVAPEIYGKLEFDDYTVEKIYFESLPGLFVTGSLYRPKTIAAGKTVPGILCPYGHWKGGRTGRMDDSAIKKALTTDAEVIQSAAENIIQARSVQLARMGCVVLVYDMVGYCNNTQIPLEVAHVITRSSTDVPEMKQEWRLYSAIAESHGLTVMGLQAINSDRAVDAILTLPEVDPERIAMTGASGGATQTFTAAALDERICVTFPSSMVGNIMQGGCSCESCAFIRLGTSNTELAALTAPRPMGLTASNDWTRAMEQDGFPEIQSIYKLLGKEENVQLFVDLRFGHNFNRFLRGHMYHWMNRHLELGLAEPIEERDFQRLSEEQMNVWDDQHPAPVGGEEFEIELLRNWASLIDQQMLHMLSGSVSEQQKLRSTLQEGWRVILGIASGVKPIGASNIASVDSMPKTGVSITVQNRQSTDSEVLYFVFPSLNIDEQPLVNSPRIIASYTYGYNLPLFAQRAQLLGMAIAELAVRYPESHFEIKGEGPDAALASAGLFCAEEIMRTSSQPTLSAELRIAPENFQFVNVDTIRSPYFLPCSARYWDLAGLVSSLGSKVTWDGEGNREQFDRLLPLREQ